MEAIDERELPGVLSPDVKRATETARALRASPAKCLIEGLLALKESGPRAFDDHVVRAYVRDQFGDEALDRYLAKIPDAAELLPVASNVGHKVSPLATAITFGPELTAGAPFLAARHLRIISDLIVKAVRGTGKRKICVCMPFRHGKSVMSSIATPLWWLSNFPHLTVGLTAHSDSLSTMFSRMVRNVIQSHPEKFGFSLAADSQSVHHFHTEMRGGLWIGAVESGILGRGCQLLVVDDPLPTAEAAASRTIRDKTWNWFTSTAMTRLQDEGVVLVCSTRWSVDDLPGRLMSGFDGIDSSEWTFVTLPAIATEDDDAVGRKKGEALFPEKRPLEELESFKRSMSAEAWACGFQNQPIEETGIGRAYGNFDPAIHVRDCEFDSRDPVRVGMDFNVSPLAFVIAQTREVIENQKRWLLSNERLYMVEVLDELLIDDCVTSDGVAALGEKLRRWKRNGPLKIIITGDASGNQRRTSASAELGTDWKIVRDYFNQNSRHFNVTYDIRRSNPGVRDRVAQVNSFLQAADGRSRFAIDPKCKGLIADLKGVRWAQDAHGNTLDVLSKKDSRLTHLSDGLGYMLWDVGSEVRFGLQAGWAR